MGAQARLAPSAPRDRPRTLRCADQTTLVIAATSAVGCRTSGLSGVSWPLGRHRFCKRPAAAGMDEHQRSRRTSPHCSIRPWIRKSSPGSRDLAQGASSTTRRTSRSSGPSRSPVASNDAASRRPEGRSGLAQIEQALPSPRFWRGADGRSRTRRDPLSCPCEPGESARLRARSVRFQSSSSGQSAPVTWLLWSRSGSSG